jgi:hypothetical protein
MSLAEIRGDNRLDRNRFDRSTPNRRFVDAIAAKCCCPDEPAMNDASVRHPVNGPEIPDRIG